MGTFVLSPCWASSLPGGKFENGIAERQVTTVLGNLALEDLASGISQSAVEKEQSHYYTIIRIMNTQKQQLLPQMMVSNPANDNTKNGEWMPQMENHKLKVCAAIMAMSELNQLQLSGIEPAKEALDKLASAAASITVGICEYEDDSAFNQNYNAGEDADHEQGQKTNSRLTNRGKLFIRARVQVGKKKTSVSAHDVVGYFGHLEATEQIKTTFAKNKVTNADDVTRVEKCYGFLLTYHMAELYERLEWSPETGPTPLGVWHTARYFMAVVESDAEITLYVLKVLEHIIFDAEDPASKLKKEKVLESGKKLQGIMKALVLEYKFMRDFLKFLEGKPVAAESKMHADLQVLKKCLDFTAFMELLENRTGIVQNLMLPAQQFHELCAKIVTQKLFTKFAEVEQNNPTYQKMYKSPSLSELIASVSEVWEKYHVQFQPKEQKVEWKDHETTDAAERCDATLTRSEAKKRVGTSDRDGYVKHYVLTGDDEVDKANLMNFTVCKTTVKDAPENLETKVGSGQFTK